jgi:hypothetical protein
MLTDEEMRERMANGWRAGRPETVCGNGSLLANTRHIRDWLPSMVAKHGIKRVCDAGAGDMHWVGHMRWAVEYQPFDLIQWRQEVTRLDITRERLPDCDAILCRMVLNHLDSERIQMALALFRQSARYLLATQFNGDKLPQRSPQFARLDLRHEPYSLGEPLEAVQDGSESICSLALWKFAA